MKRVALSAASRMSLIILLASSAAANAENATEAKSPASASRLQEVKDADILSAGAGLYAPLKEVEGAGVLTPYPTRGGLDGYVDYQRTLRDRRLQGRLAGAAGIASSGLTLGSAAYSSVEAFEKCREAWSVECGVASTNALSGYVSAASPYIGEFAEAGGMIGTGLGVGATAAEGAYNCYRGNGWDCGLAALDTGFEASALLGFEPIAVSYKAGRLGGKLLDNGLTLMLGRSLGEAGYDGYESARDWLFPTDNEESSPHQITKPPVSDRSASAPSSQQRPSGTGVDTTEVDAILKAALERTRTARTDVASSPDLARATQTFSESAHSANAQITSVATAALTRSTSSMSAMPQMGSSTSGLGGDKWISRSDWEKLKSVTARYCANSNDRAACEEQTRYNQTIGQHVGD